MWLYSILRGWFKTKVKISLYFLHPGTWWYIINTRRKLRNITKIEPFWLYREFVSKIQFQDIKNPILKYVANPGLSIYWKIVKKFI